MDAEERVISESWGRGGEVAAAAGAEGTAERTLQGATTVGLGTSEHHVCAKRRECLISVNLAIVMVRERS